MKYTKETLIPLIRQSYINSINDGEPFVISHYKRLGLPTRITISRKFGSWNDALVACGIPINKIAKTIKVLTQCIQCNKFHSNDKFCSHSCSASYNNIGSPKHGDPTRSVCKCGSRKDNRAKTCHTCKTEETRNRWANMTIAELEREAGHPSYRNNEVRQHAKKMMKFWDIPKECDHCGYDAHVECCHIISIKDFPTDTTLAVVNHKDNLVFLCRNHHWEQEHGLIEKYKPPLLGSTG